MERLIFFQILSYLNLFNFVKKLSDIWTFAGYPFKSGIWSDSSTDVSFAEGGSFLADKYKYLLWISFGASVIYGFMSVSAVHHAKNGTLGIVKTFKTNL